MTKGSKHSFSSASFVFHHHFKSLCILCLYCTCNFVQLLGYDRVRFTFIHFYLEKTDILTDNCLFFFLSFFLSPLPPPPPPPPPPPLAFSQTIVRNNSRKIWLQKLTFYIWSTFSKTVHLQNIWQRKEKKKRNPSAVIDDHFLGFAWIFLNVLSTEKMARQSFPYFSYNFSVTSPCILRLKHEIAIEV